MFNCIVSRMSMKLCKEVLFAITMGVEQVVLQNSARLIQHTASASVASILSTGAATFGMNIRLIHASGCNNINIGLHLWQLSEVWVSPIISINL